MKAQCFFDESATMAVDVMDYQVRRTSGMRYLGEIHDTRARARAGFFLPADARRIGSIILFSSTAIALHRSRIAKLPLAN